VVSDLACFRDFVAPGRNGWSFDHRGAAPADALIGALQRAAQERTRELAERALAVRETHSVTRIAELFLADFAAVANG
jgi:hypothetical protein